MNVFKKIWGTLSSYFRSGRAERDLKLACAYVSKAAPIIETIAALTPTRVDDELIALYKRFALPGVEALREVARTVLAREVQPGTPQRVLNAAIELAYLSYAGNKP